MARVKIDDSIIALNTGVGTTASVTIQKRFDSSTATLYAAETGGTTVGNPVTATNGRLEVWVDEGRYNLIISSGSFTTYTQAFEAKAGATRGKVAIATTETRSSSSYGLLTTPDQVSNLILPTDGFIAVLYHATWSNTGSGRAAIFLNSIQAKVGTNNGAAAIQEVDVTGTVNDGWLHTSATGLLSQAQVGSAVSDVTTGQIIAHTGTGGGGGLSNVAAGGGPCYLFANAGTYSVSIQYKATSGVVSAKNRKLWAWVEPF
jgi:hypothetical protein